MECTTELLSWVKAVVGPLIGAGLAFGTTLLVQHWSRSRDNLCAGNLALLTISAQYNDLLIYRRKLREELHKRDSQIVGLPLWLLAPSIGPQLPARTLDFKSLAFLFDKRPGIETHQHLFLAEQHYEALRSTNERLSKFSEEIQAAMAIVTSRSPPPTNAEVQSSIGADKRAITADLLKGAVVETQSEKFYLDAFAALRNMLANLFEASAVPRSISAMEGHAESDLPALPKALT